MQTRRIVILGAQILVALLVVTYGGARYLTSMPGTSYEGALPPLAPDEKELSAKLRTHVETIAARERNLAHYDALEDTARYIEATLRQYGLPIKSHPFTVDGKTVRNIEATIAPQSASEPREIVVIGAHYDSAPGSPGADSNASGVAALLELAPKLAGWKDGVTKEVRLVFFVNGEAPYFKTPAMGSLRYAQELSAGKARVAAMLSLDSVGYYSTAPHSQRHAFIMNFLLPSRGDFIAFLARHSSYSLIREAVGAFRNNTQFPSIGVMGPDFHPDLNASDQWAFAEKGYPALVITDTGRFRYPHFRLPTDTPDKLDYDRLALVAKGIVHIAVTAAR
jgi:Zn-dependent M28 family amino/carboxypeptidase